MKRFVLILAVSWAVSGAAQAATLTYDDNLADASDNRNTATIVGSLQNLGDSLDVVGGTDVDSGDIRDFFGFTSHTGFNFQLNSITIEANRPNHLTPPSASIRIYEADGSFIRGDQTAHKRVSTGESGTTFYTLTASGYSVRTFAAGNYIVLLNAYNPNEGVITNYSFSLNALPAIAPVPVPAGLPLLASGFVVFAWLRKRKAA